MLSPGTWNTKRLVATLIAIIVMMGLILLNRLLFRVLLQRDYFDWFLQEAPIIALVVSVLALVWENLKARWELLSIDPLEYTQGCFTLLAVLLNSLGTLAKNLAYMKKGLHFDRDPLTGSPLAIKWDSTIGIAWVFVLATLAFAWLILIAPLNYLATIFTGVLARNEIRGPVFKPVVRQEGRTTIITEQMVFSPRAAASTGTSLTSNPFALTQLLSGLLFLLLRFLLDITGM